MLMRWKRSSAVKLAIAYILFLCLIQGGSHWQKVKPLQLLISITDFAGTSQFAQQFGPQNVALKSSTLGSKFKKSFCCLRPAKAGDKRALQLLCSIETVKSAIYDLACQASSLLLATILASAKYIGGKKYCIFQIENVGPPLLSGFSVVSKYP